MKRSIKHHCLNYQAFLIGWSSKQNTTLLNSVNHSEWKKLKVNRKIGECHFGRKSFKKDKCETALEWTFDWRQLLEIEIILRSWLKAESQMTFGQMGRIPQKKNYKNHSMIKNLKLLVIFRRVSVVCLLGKFLLPQVETKIIEWFLYVWKNTQTEKNYVILIQKPNHSESHKYTVEKFVWCFLKKKKEMLFLNYLHETKD